MKKRQPAAAASGAVLEGGFPEPAERKWIERGILLYLIFAAMAYLPEALNDILNARISYAKFSINEPLFGLNIRYFKDAILVLMTAAFFALDARKGERYRLSKWYLPVLLLIAYGTCVLVFREAGLNVYQVAAGGRSLLLIVFCLKAAVYSGRPAFVRRLCRCAGWLLVIEFAVLVAQYVLFTGRFGVVNPFSLRLIGTFGGISISGYMALGSSILLYSSRGQLDRTMQRLSPLLQLLCLGIAGISGTRSAIIGCFLILFFLLVEKAFGGRKLPGKSLLMPAVVCFSMLVLTAGIQAATLMADRGSIVEAQVKGGRIDMVTGFFTDNPLSVVLFGDGIGYGTNSGVNLNKQLDVELEHKIMDGTINSILTQYGLFVLFLLAAAAIAAAPAVLRRLKGQSMQLYVLLVVNVVLCISTNILEQFVYLFLLALSAAVLARRNQQAAAEEEPSQGTEGLLSRGRMKESLT